MHSAQRTGRPTPRAYLESGAVPTHVKTQGETKKSSKERRAEKRECTRAQDKFLQSTRGPILAWSFHLKFDHFLPRNNLSKITETSLNAYTYFFTHLVKNLNLT